MHMGILTHVTRIRKRITRQWHGFIRPQERNIRRYERKAKKNYDQDAVKIRIKESVRIALDRIGEDNPARRKEVIGRILNLSNPGQSVTQINRKEIKLTSDMKRWWGEDSEYIFFSKFRKAFSKLGREDEVKREARIKRPKVE